jgi:formyl-CoA transferase
MDTKTPHHPSLKRKAFSAGSRGPLHGLRVIDLSRLVAGNMLTLQLADFGADVIKVEPRNGDTLRAFRTSGIEAFWKVYCRNKRSVCIDFRHERAVGLLRRMIDKADVLVESFRPGVLEEMGLAPDTLHTTNPRLVIARISGWGQTGPFKRRPGFGTLVEGYSGFASMNGFADREPVLPPMFLGDMTAGLYGASAVMTALWEVRVNGGKGQQIDLSLFEPMISVLGPQVANYRITGKVKPRTGSRSSTTAPRNTYRTSDDRWVCVSTSTQTMAARLFCAIGRPDMNTDPRYSSNMARLEHVEEVDAIVSAFVGQRTLAENLRLFEAAEVTVGPIHDASDLLSDDYVIARESLVEVQDDDLEYMPMHNIVPRLSATPGTLRRPAPRKGQHTAECLAELLGDLDLQPLIDDGVIFPDAPSQA